MSMKRSPTDHPQVQRALDELRVLIQQRYPEATFSVTRGQDDPQAIHLNAVVDLEDTDEVLDLVIERVVQLQTEDGLAVHVIPLRPLERERAMMREARSRPYAWSLSR